jgi:3-methyladenine DNA glycosylase AlkD
MDSFTLGIQEKLTGLANPGKAAEMSAYLKNQFSFLGIKMLERRLALKEYVKQHAIKDEHELEEVTRELWNLPEREYQYCAIELLAYYKKLWQESIINCMEYCITNRSWWDTVDFIATECLGPYFKMHPKHILRITKQWNQSTNMWLQRSSLLFQKNYKKDTDTKLLSEYILNLTSSKEFFIQKAIGWMLREYGKTDAAWVVNFVNKNELAPLSKREAIKHLLK